MLKICLDYFVIFLFPLMQLQSLVSSQIIWPGTGEECNIVGSLSRVVCLTETYFKLSLDSSEIYSCPLGTVCANHQNICVNSSVPVCSTPRCGRCLPGATGTCIEKKQYIDCDGTGNTTGTPRYCQASRPYCRVDYENGIPVRSCSVIISEECNDGPATPPTDPPPSPCPTNSLPPPQLDVCTTDGVFESKTDPTCKRYYYCYYSNEQLVKVDYVCPADSVFHPDKKKCVIRRDFQCDYYEEEEVQQPC